MAAASNNETGQSGVKQRRRRPLKLPECCSYDQVYARIIEMLSSATNSNDTALGRALVDELEVSNPIRPKKPCLPHNSLPALGCS